jgi:hypothetical protein
MVLTSLRAIAKDVPLAAADTTASVYHRTYDRVIRRMDYRDYTMGQ